MLQILLGRKKYEEAISDEHPPFEEAISKTLCLKLLSSLWLNSISSANSSVSNFFQTLYILPCMLSSQKFYIYLNIYQENHFLGAINNKFSMLANDP